MFKKINSVGLFGLNAFMVEAEIDSKKGSGSDSFEIVGLPDTSVKESKERVYSAVTNSGFSFPKTAITVNLAPADMRKSGSAHDLAIFVAVLSSMGQIPDDISDCAFIGELSLGGGLRRVNGALTMAIEAKNNGIKKFFVPYDNAFEASSVGELEVYGIRDVGELLAHLSGKSKKIPTQPYIPHESDFFDHLDFSDVKGQDKAKLALEIAVTGGHNVLLIGTPGSGKSMLSKRLPSIMPPMTFKESIETTQVHSVAGKVNANNPLITKRPFRAPHHTVSMAGLVGGGTVPKPGELSLAHNGVLFLDELPEFQRNTLEVLRQPLEERKVTISRAYGTLEYPCSVMLVTAMNPCPCGYYGHPTRKCTCTDKQISNYLSKISGPLLDRIDLHIEVAPVEYSDLKSDKKAETSKEIRERIAKAREIQNKRFEGTEINCNAQITPNRLREFCPMDSDAEKMLEGAFNTMGLSGRAYDRLLKVARTCADLDGEEIIKKEHNASAIQYRSLDRKYWSR